MGRPVRELSEATLGTEEGQYRRASLGIENG